MKDRTLGGREIWVEDAFARGTRGNALSGSLEGLGAGSGLSEAAAKERRRREAKEAAERAASAHDPDEASVARVDVLGPHPGEVYGCAFVGDGEGGGPMLATAAGADLRLWDLEAAVEVARVESTNDPCVSARCRSRAVSLETRRGCASHARSPARV